MVKHHQQNYIVLDYFKVPEKDVVIVKPEILKETTKLMFMKCGVSNDEAELGADVLLHADLRGIETHGVSRGRAFIYP